MPAIRDSNFRNVQGDGYIARYYVTAPPTREGPRVNNDIDVAKVRLVGADGENVGIVGIEEALDMAAEAGMDLVEVSPNADPPEFGPVFVESEPTKPARSRRRSTSRKSRCGRTSTSTTMTSKCGR